MGIRLYEEPKLKDPVLIASWPGIGNIGIIAVNYLRQMVKARELGEIEPWDFFDPRRVLIEGGLLKELEFPSSKFYFQRTKNRDLIFFVGEQQPTETGTPYPGGRKVLEIANRVLDVALRFGCRRVYVSGAALAPIHHTARPKVWAVPNSESLVSEVRSYENTVLMSDVEGRGGQGSITGLNGLLLGVAKKRGLEAVCVLGEIPFYLQGLAMVYPKASKSVLEVLTKILEVEIDFSTLDKMVAQVEQGIGNLEEQFYQQTPPEVAERIRTWLESFKHKPAESRPITEEDQKWLKEHIDELFKRGGEEDDRPL